MFARFNHSTRVISHAGRGLFLPLLITLLFTGIPSPAGALPPPPATATGSVIDTLHGKEIADPYRWLEDQESPETRAWIDAQNAYTRSVLDSLPGRDKIAARLTELLKVDDVGMPTERGGRYFFSKRSADQEQYIIYMREGIDGPDQVIIDPHSMSPDNSVSVNLWEVSSDGKTIAYAYQQGGKDEEIIRLYNVDNKEYLTDSLPQSVYFGFSLLRDLSGFYYAQRTEDGPRVYFHAMGSDPNEDRLLFGEDLGPDKIATCFISDNYRWLIIKVSYGSSGMKNDLYFKDLENDGPITALVNDLEAQFDAEIGDDIAYLQTDWDAPNYRILAADLENPSRENWREVIPTGEAPIRYFTMVGGKLCVNYLKNVQSVVRIFQPDGEFVREIAFPAIGSVGAPYGQWDKSEAFFSFQSFHIPPTIYRYDIANDTREVWSSYNAPVNSDDFEVKQLWYNSKDGTRVPMFVVHRKGLKLDGSNPTLMYGYGGFGGSMTPYFSTSALLWVEQGGVYVSTNLRGGGEFGEEWHRAAMFEKKQNTFDDLYAAAEYLIDHGYTNQQKLAARGGSNGGLLVGAALTQRPELFRAIMCTYPLLDMLRYHKSLMGPYWVSEYGSADDPEQFEYIHAYSPYHQVKPGIEYPAVLFVTGDSDTRVDPMHARKMTALMQASTGSDKPILLHYDIQSGHSGGTPISKLVKDYTDYMCFLFWQLGVTPK